jgi:antitoxin PrlF
MLSTLTSKGQITLPKEIRDRLGLAAGAILDFQLLPDDTITVRSVKPDARRIRGLLISPNSSPLTVAQMDKGIARQLKAKHASAAREVKGAKR